MSWAQDAGRIARTLGYLRPTQVAYYPLRRLQSFFPVPAPAIEGRPAEVAWARAAREVVAWGPGDPAGRLNRAQSLLRREYTFLNHTERLADIDWSATHASPLWTYRLHGFEYATDLAWAFRLSGDRRYLDRFVELFHDWLRGASLRRGLGWQPYVVSSRTIHWTYALLLVRPELPADVVDRVVASILSQLAGLARRLELHLQANHLQRNLSALALGALLFDARGILSRRERWVPGLWQEFLRQVAPDGVHAERSSMYHGIALADLLEAICLARAVGEPVPTELLTCGRRMSCAWSVLSRPDGSLHLMNDSANGETAPPPYLAQLTARAVGAVDPAHGAVRFAESGFYAWIDPERGERLLIDAGPPAPSHQPGHAHAGLLSFELDLGGRPVIVNAGLSGYAGDPFRGYVRSTRAHNTCTIDDHDQAEMWGVFRVGGRPILEQAVLEDGPFEFRGAYRPYFSQQIVHRRRIRREGDAWLVEDGILGAAGHRVESHLHFHPDFVLKVDGNRVLAEARGCSVTGEILGRATPRIVRGARDPLQGWYCPAFGIQEPAAVLTLATVAGQEEMLGIRLWRIGN